MENRPDMENRPVTDKQPVAKTSLAVRIILLILALIVLIGSITYAVAPAGDRGGRENGALTAARAESEWKTLQKGSSGAAVRRAQQALKELGYYQGKIDGNFSKAFEEAVIAFQKDFGLDPSGKLDEETYLLITEDLPEEEPAQAPAKATATPKPASQPKPTDAPDPTEDGKIVVVFGQDYSDKDHVAWYIHTYGELPPNYITKNEAQDLGWVSSKGNLWDVAPGRSIGGDYFGNYEGKLPTAKGRKYTECDIDFDGSYRNGKRIIFSNDGLVFYTEDHYETFVEIVFE